MPDVGADCITFRLADPERELVGVTLVQEVAWPRAGPTFVRPASGPDWVAALPLPEVDRLEYLFELHRPGGGAETVVDAGNPQRAAGPFGDKSVVDLPGYRRPAWLEEAPAPSGTVTETTLTSRALRRDLDVVLWTSAGHDHGDQLPLLLVHDGVDYARYAGLVAFLDRAVAHGRLPPCHAALLVPSQRDLDYSASIAYASALIDEVIPEVERHLHTPRTRDARVGMGTSLGGLAMLHAHRLHPGALGGLFLQSASLFLTGVDDHEAWFDHQPRIGRFVHRLLERPEGPDPIPLVMTCGGVEEKVHGNRAVAHALGGAGYAVRLEVVRDSHNWTAWRDTFDPHLAGLLQEMWA